MKILALTGGIAAGKSTVAQLFRDLGAVVLDADKIAHRVYLPKGKVHRAIQKRYGKQILDRSGKIDRKKLAGILFGSKQERAWLEAQIHPETRRLIGAEIQKAIRKKAPLILVEAALHLETGYHKPFHGLLVVSAAPKVQLQRLMKREGLNAKEARLKVSSQMSQARKRAAADWIIDNSGTLRSTRTQVRRLMKEFLE